jgi:ADP-ribose pyrophosphatase YjhB (NUDIX family)
MAERDGLILELVEAVHGEQAAARVSHPALECVNIRCVSAPSCRQCAGHAKMNSTTPPADPLSQFRTPAINFCPACGAPAELKIPKDDTRVRAVCTRCGTIHYQNPKLVVGAIAVWENRVLLCKRAIEPRHGKWTLPAGFMENDETVAQAAQRETLEEACASIELGPLFSMISVPYINQVHVFYLARLLNLEFAPGVESLQVALFDQASIPWEEIAFRTVAKTLQFYFEDAAKGEMHLHCEDLVPRPA